MSFLRISFALALTLVASPLTLWADFPELFNTEPDGDAPVMTATESAAQMQLPEGFSVTVFAAEPDVQNPIDFAWDSRGRLWIAENYTYAERDQRFQLDLRDRVLVLEDADGDGDHDHRTVFTDSVQMLTSVEVGHGGVWLMCPPQLLFIPDRNRDDVPDGPAEVVLDGFDVAKQNYHNFANGLRFGPDGWLYGRSGGSCPGRIGAPGTADEQRVALEGGIWRYHPVTGHVEVLTAGTTNPWGLDWNEVGDLFFTNTVNGHFWQAIPGAHFTRPFTLDPNRHTYELIDFHADHWHFDTGKSWTDSRDGAANDYGGGHAHCGLMIYQSNQWPQQYRGRALTLNMHGRRANQERLERHGSGYVARHETDFLLPDDPWFRGMDLTTGPDGGVYLLDWSDTGECHEHTGVHRTSGRVFKITYDAAASPSAVDAELVANDLNNAGNEQLLGLQMHPNAWFAHQSRLALAVRASSPSSREPAWKELVQAARTRFAQADDSEAAVRLLLTAHAISPDPKFLFAQLEHSDEYVRAWAVRLLTESWTLDDAYGPTRSAPDQRPGLAFGTMSDARLIDKLVAMGADDPSPHVRLTLASTLQRLPIESRAQLAAQLVGHAEDADDHNLPLMIWYGLMPVADTAPERLVEVAMACRLPTTLRLISRRLAEDLEQNPGPLNAVLDATVSGPLADCRLDVLTGLSEGLQGWRSAPRPAAWDALVAATTDEPAPDERSRTLVRELSVVFGDGRSIDEVKRVIADRDAAPEIRLSALEALIRTQPADLRQICEPLLKDARMNVVAARGLSSIDDPEVGRLLVARYNNFRAPQRPLILSILVSRASFAKALLSAMQAGRIPHQDLSAFQVRQIHSLGDAELSETVAEVWGEVRETPQAKQQAITAVKSSLSPETVQAADQSAGRGLFVKLCYNCHRMYGEGGEIGPDLTGANRNNLDYLLSNVIDPSGVVDKDFRMTVIVMADGRVFSGLVTARSDRTLVLHTATESLTLDRREIEQETVTDKSPMPEGLLDQLTAEQTRDLISYLMHPGQVALPSDAEPAD